MNMFLNLHSIKIKRNSDNMDFKLRQEFLEKDKVLTEHTKTVK